MSRRDKFAAVLFLSVMGCSGTPPSTPDPITAPDPEISGPRLADVARYSLAEVREIATVIDDSAFGMLSNSTVLLGDDPDVAALGLQIEPPIPVVVAFVKDLAAYTGGSYRGLLSDTLQYLYPLIVNGVLGGCLVIDDHDTAYTLAAIGGRNWIRDVVRTRRSAALRFQPAATSDFFLIKVPSLNTFYIASGPPDNLTMQIVSHSTASNTDSTGALAFQQLALRAQNHNGKAR